MNQDCPQSRRRRPPRGACGAAAGGEVSAALFAMNGYKRDALHEHSMAAVANDDWDVKYVYDAFRSYLENSLGLHAQWPLPTIISNCRYRTPVEEYVFEFKDFRGVGMKYGCVCTRVKMNGSYPEILLPARIVFYDPNGGGIGIVLASRDMHTQLDDLITKSTSPAVAALSVFDLKTNNSVCFVFIAFLEKKLGLDGPWPHGTLNIIIPENSLASYAYAEQTFEFNQWHGFKMRSNRRCARIKMRGLAVGDKIPADDAGPSVGFYDEEGGAFAVARGHTSDQLYHQLTGLLIRDDSVEASPTSSSVVVVPQKVRDWTTLVKRVDEAVDGFPSDAGAASSNQLVLEIMRACVQLLKLKAGVHGH
jgi:hypothetical protein